MPFHRYGKTVKFPRNEHVEIHVREVTLNASAPTDAQVENIEIREYLRDGEVYGHGLIIPRHNARDLCSALDKLGLFEKPSTGA